MTCYAPITAYHIDTTVKGKKVLSFKEERDEHKYPQVTVPCGKCIGCKLTKSRHWAVRCVHEAQLHEDNSFITLTFDEENIPDNRSISKRDLQLFFKKLRKKIHPKQIRYFACGEYGEQRNRPHYHAIIFNWWPQDALLWSKSPTGDLLFRSQTLEQLWPYGYSSIGRVTFQSAAYVARYQFKKQTDKKEYELVDTDTGELHDLEPEFILMSRRPGIGYEWFKKYHKDTEKDFIHLGDKRVSVPAYYDYLRESTDPELLENIKILREANVQDLIIKGELTPERIESKRICKEAQLKQLKRNIE